MPAARANGIRVCLGSDWAPSGTKHVLAELKAARLVADAEGWELDDADLVRMATSTPGDVLTRSWPRQVGRLVPGALADVLVLRAAAGADPFAAVVGATEADVELVLVEGVPRYGTAASMEQSGVTGVSPLLVAGRERLLALPRPDDAAAGWDWNEVLARMEQVRADPAAEITLAQERAAAFAGPVDAAEAPLRLRLDMPTGVGPTAGLPTDLDEVVVPPLASLTHDDAWLDAVAAGGFHDGLLAGLDHWYRT